MPATYHSFFKALDVAAAEQALGVRARGDAPVEHIAIARAPRRRGASGCAPVGRVQRMREVAGKPSPRPSP